jgi:cell division protein FtsA
MTHRLLVIEVDDGQATVWGWAEIPGPGGEAPEVDWLIDTCGKALRRAEEMAQDLAERWILPDRMVVGLPASQLVGRAWPISQRRSRPRRPIEERELEALLGRGLRLAVNRLLSLAAEEEKWLLIDAATVALTIDDQGVTDPVGFRAREMGTTVFAALAPAQAIGAWQLVAEELEFIELILAASPVALAAGVSEPQGILIDVGSATTDLVRCRTGRPTALDSLPEGGSALTRSLVRKWNLAPDRAERLKQAYAGGRLEAEGMAQVQEAMLPGLQKWLAETEKGLARLNQDEPLPQQLYLLGGGSALPEIGESVRALAWSRRLQFARYPEVHRLRPTDVPGVVNRTEMGRGAGDVAALALAAWTAHQQQPPDRPARILAGLCHG